MESEYIYPSGYAINWSLYIAAVSEIAQIEYYH